MVFFYFGANDRTERQKETPQRGTHKGDGRSFGSWPKQTVFNQRKCCLFFPAWVTWKHYQMQNDEERMKKGQRRREWSGRDRTRGRQRGFFWALLFSESEFIFQNIKQGETCFWHMLLLGFNLRQVKTSLKEISPSIYWQHYDIDQSIFHHLKMMT